MKITKFDTYFIISFIFAVWFALSSFAWVYYVNLLFSLPFGILSLVFWHFGKKSDTNKNRYKYILYILGTGVLISLIVLVFLLMRN